MEGDCDERGTPENNLALGGRRAGGASAYLVSLGIAADRLRTVSYGKEFPFDAGHDDQAKAERKAFADKKLIVDTLSNDLRVVREKVDDTNVRLGSVSQEVDALRQALQSAAAPRATAVEPPEGGGQGAAPPDLTNPAAVPLPLAVGTSPTRLYEQAYSNFGAGLFDLAIDGFEAYVRSFPKSD